MQQVDFNSFLSILLPTTIGSVGWFQCKLTALIGTLIDHHITLAR